MLSTAATLIAVGGLSLAGAGSASAHSAMVNGTAQCQSDGAVSVTWTVTNDYQLPVQVSQTGTSGGGSISGLPVSIDAVSSSGNTSATVQQVGIAAGTATATLAVHGVWSDGYATDGHGTVTLPKDCAPTTTEVTPVAPVLTTSDACDVPGSITVADTKGVSYFLDGAPIAAGQHVGPISGTVTAKASEGYVLTGTSSWPVSVPVADTCSVEATPVAPVLTTSDACDVPGSLTIADTKGVSYFLDGAPIAAGQHVGPISGTVTGKAVEGFELTGKATWVVQIAAAADCATGSGETGGGEGSSVKTAPPASATPAGVSTAAPAELAFTGLSPQALTFGVGGGLTLLLLGGGLTATAARLRR